MIATNLRRAFMQSSHITDRKTLQCTTEATMSIAIIIAEVIQLSMKGDRRMHPLHQSTLAASTPIEPTKKSTLVEVLLMNLLDLATNSRESMMIEGQDIPNLQGLGLEKCIGNPRLAVKATWRVADRAGQKHHLLSIEMHLHLSHDSPSYHLRRRLRERSPRDRN